MLYLHTEAEFDLYQTQWKTNISRYNSAIETSLMKVQLYWSWVETLYCRKWHFQVFIKWKISCQPSSFLSLISHPHFWEGRSLCPLTHLLMMVKIILFKSAACAYQLVPIFFHSTPTLQGQTKWLQNTREVGNKVLIQENTY